MAEVYCKNCGSVLTPAVEKLHSSDPYYRGAARCRACEYLYFPEDPATWNAAAWVADFDHKAEVILQQAYAAKNDWRRDVYLLLHFVECVDSMVTAYFSSAEFSEHEHLLAVLQSLDATKSVDTLRSVVRLAGRPEQVLERFGLVGDTSEQVDDAWEEVTGELSQRLDVDLRKRIYDRYLCDHNLAEFLAK